MVKQNAQIYIKRYGIFLVMVALMLVFTFLNPVFLTSSNLINVVRQVSMIGIASIGGMYVMLIGGIDLSQGSLLSLLNILCAYFMATMDMNMWLAILICLILSAGVGYVNGMLVTFARIPALIATLATQYVLLGIAYIICKGQSIFGFPDAFRVFGQGYLGVIPVPVLVFIAFLAIGAFLLNKTFLGRSFYSIGGNAEAAQLSGIKVGRVKRIAYLLSGLFTGVASIITLSRVNSGQANSGDGFEFDCITAIVLGGVSVNGGAGRLYNVVAGVLIVGILNNGLVLIGMSNYLQMVIKGVILAVAVGIDCVQKKEKY